MSRDFHRHLTGTTTAVHASFLSGGRREEGGRRGWFQLLSLAACDVACGTCTLNPAITVYSSVHYLSPLYRYPLLGMMYVLSGVPCRVFEGGRVNLLLCPHGAPVRGETEVAHPSGFGSEPLLARCPLPGARSFRACNGSRRGVQGAYLMHRKEDQEGGGGAASIREIVGRWGVFIETKPRVLQIARQINFDAPQQNKRFQQMRSSRGTMRRTHKPFPYGATTPHTLQGAGAAGGGGGEGLELQDPKLQYLKNLMLKYLGTDEGEAREHMERAIATVLQFSEQVRRRVFLSSCFFLL